MPIYLELTEERSMMFLREDKREVSVVAGFIGVCYTKHK